MFPCTWVVGSLSSQNKGPKAEQQPWIKIQLKRSLTVNSEEGRAHSHCSEVTSPVPVQESHNGVLNQNRGYHNPNQRQKLCHGSSSSRGHGILQEENLCIQL